MCEEPPWLTGRADGATAPHARTARPQNFYNQHRIFHRKISLHSYRKSLQVFIVLCCQNLGIFQDSSYTFIKFIQIIIYFLRPNQVFLYMLYVRATTFSLYEEKFIKSVLKLLDQIHPSSENSLFRARFLFFKFERFFSIFQNFPKTWHKPSGQIAHV